MVRRMYLEGKGVPSLVAVFQDYTGKAKDVGLAYAKGIRRDPGRCFETTFKEETETDLFGEQAVLCRRYRADQGRFRHPGGAGYAPEMAYFECLHEMKLIIDLAVEGGLSYMRYSISNTAEYGDYVTSKRIITDETRKEMKDLAEIQEGEFAKKWILENQANRPVYNARAKQEKEHLIEKVGAELRKMMPWLQK